MRPFKVVGAAYPRSGTKYMAEVMRAFGLDVLHESTGADGGIGYNQVDFDPSKVDVILYWVRDPRRVLASCCMNVPAKGTDLGWTLFDSDASAWLKTARNAGCKAFHFRIEGVASLLPDIAKALGINPDWDAVEAIPIDTNHGRDYTPLQWGDLGDDVRRLALDYGYTPDPIF